MAGVKPGKVPKKGYHYSAEGNVLVEPGLADVTPCFRTLGPLA